MGPSPGVRRNDAPSSKVDPLAIPPATGFPLVWVPSGTRGGSRGRRGTLFGPEGVSPRTRRGVLRDSFSRGHLENFRASASIWAKLGRAHGGCLGARSR